MNHSLKVFTQKEDFNAGIRIVFYEPASECWKKVRAITDIKFEELEPTEDYNGGLRIGFETAQMLIDSLWDCGIRPSEGSGSAGALKAAEGNIADLRTITSRLLGLLERSFE